MRREEILTALRALAARLHERGIEGELGLTHADEVLTVAEEVYGDRLDAAARFFVEELFAD